jgi:hypothetical protein
MLGKSQLLFLIEENRFKKYKNIFHILYEQNFLEQVVLFLHKQLKYSYPISSCSAFKDNMVVMGNKVKTDNITSFNIYDRPGIYNLYSYYVNTSQKEFIIDQLSGLIKNNDTAHNFNDLYIRLLIQSGIRLKVSNVEPVLELVYFKQCNGLSLTDPELKIQIERKIPLNKPNQELIIIPSMKFKLDDIKRSTEMYWLSKLKINETHMQLIG